MIARLSKKNQNGQMAIFVALIFQILFLFFAMAINIGLVVHDKINLQNAVDLSAYYAAQRQAEMLNVIAHTNYQIRQSWKLLNWRYYVLGSMGVQSPWHPASRRQPYAFNETEVWSPPSQAMCITYSPQWIGIQQDNPCKSQDFRVPNITVPPVIAPFLPFNIIFSSFARSLQKKIAQSCEGYSGYNWYMAAATYVAYMLDQANRKELIRALAMNLAKNPREMIDLKGDSVFVGAQKTFMKNLTAPNNPDPKNPPVIEIYNSLEGLRPQQWLPEIDIWFTMLYQELQSSNKECSTVIKQVDQLPQKGWGELTNLTGDPKMLENLHGLVAASTSIGAGDSRRLSLGVEKNPWYMAYVGVRAKTQPRQLFFPFGEPVQFEAKAFAQPFGGRVGPWYGKMWSRGAESSSGDRLQLSPEKLQANGMLNTSVVTNLLPQYSKYPGDRVGLKSTLAQNSLVDQYGLRASLYDYADITAGFGPGRHNDILAAQDPSTSVRKFEMAAISPDLFDITYYSIQPNFAERYLRDLRGNRDKLGLSENGFPRGDLGSRDPDSTSFSVQNQIVLSAGLESHTAVQNPSAFWYVRDRAHLLTSWVHSDTYGEYFAFPGDRFGQCEKYDDDLKIKAPGSCVDRGGRTGYSVKIISPEVLRSALPLGGGDQGTGTILNPPPEGW